MASAKTCEVIGREIIRTNSVFVIRKAFGLKPYRHQRASSVRVTMVGVLAIFGIERLELALVLIRLGDGRHCWRHTRPEAPRACASEVPMAGRAETGVAKATHLRLRRPWEPVGASFWDSSTSSGCDSLLSPSACTLFCRRIASLAWAWQRAGRASAAGRAGVGSGQGGRRQRAGRASAAPRE